MKKHFILFCAVLISKLVLCQTLAHSFEFHPQTSFHDFSEHQIDSFICKAKLENFRLRSSKTTLPFDNGFEIVLLSADELVHLGLISSSESYQSEFPADYRLPVFHVTATGGLTAGYIASGKAKATR